MAKYFTEKELCASATADRKCIDNTPNSSAKRNLEYLMKYLLDPIRELWGKPIRINSGYRCSELNAAVGGVSTSQHLTGQAADIDTGTDEGNKELFELIKNSDLIFDQVIDENNFSWIHVSYVHNRQEIFNL